MITKVSKRMRVSFRAAALSTALALTVGTAAATIVAVQPAAVLFTPASVLPGLDTAPDIYAFDEQQGVQLLADTPVDIVPAKEVEEPADLNPGIIPAGTCVNSHYMKYEDLAGASAVTGGIEVGEPILGVAVLQTTLDQTNFLGLAGVAYPVTADCVGITAGADCGMEITSPPQDRIRVGLFRVRVNFGASTPGDRVRVSITGRNAPIEAEINYLSPRPEYTR